MTKTDRDGTPEHIKLVDLCIYTRKNIAIID